MPKALAPLFLIALFAVSGCSSTPAEKNISSTDRARLYVEAANGALAEGDPTGALVLLKKAETENNEVPEIFHSRAIALYVKRDIKGAIESARRAVEIKPDYADANNTLGKLLIDAGDYNAAEKVLQSPASNVLYRESYKSNTSLGIIHYRRGNLAKATENLDKAIFDAPVAACMAYYYRGHVYLKKGEFKNAIRDYGLATRKVCANFADAHLALATAYERNKDYELARKKYLDIKMNFPNTKIADQAMDRLRYLP